MQKLPIKALKEPNKISEMCNETNEPIFITKNGYGDMVIMSMKTYEERIERINMFDAIQDGLANIEDDKVKDGKVALNDIKFKL